MSGHDFEQFSDGEWDERSELVWNEYDWQQYLRQNEKEIARFLALYSQNKHRPDRLDEVARLMGWSGKDWSPAEDAPPVDAKSTSASAPQAHTQPDASGEALDDTSDIYTIHKHPVFIASRALYQQLHHAWEHFLGGGNAFSIGSGLAWKYSASLHGGELNAMMALHALDMGDYALAICHLKNALSAVNHSLSMLPLLHLDNTAHHVQFFRDLQGALFDLREIWLRVMNDCREENHRRSTGEQGAHE